MKPYFYECRLFTLLLVIAIKVQTALSHRSHDEPSGRHLEEVVRCGTAEAGVADITIQKRVVEKFLTSSDRVDNEIVIPVCFYVISDDTGNNSLSNSDLQRQFDALNKAFGSSSCCNTSLDWCLPGTCSINTGLKFAMARVDKNGAIIPDATTSYVSASDACVSRLVNNDWAYLEMSEDVAMKTALRRGNSPKTLHVYFTDLPALGYTLFPWAIVPGSIRDGVVVQASSIPGGTNVRYNEGDTLAHEVGHWMGLPHTFAGGCSISDGIDDTAPQAKAYGGCSPSTRPDTCPGSGPDPIFNFMDYSLDACMYEFTPGQALAMKASYRYFRLGDKWENNIVNLRIRETSAPINLIPRERQIFQVQITKMTTCSVSGNEGNVDLYMNLLSPPSWSAQDLCVSTSAGSTESCSTGNIGDISNIAMMYPAQQVDGRSGPIRLFFRALARFLKNTFSSSKPQETVPLFVGIVALGNTPAQNIRVRCS